MTLEATLRSHHGCREPPLGTFLALLMLIGRQMREGMICAARR
jgi:hypothetical protein